MAEISFQSLNPFNGVGIGSIGTFGSIALVIAISVVILGLVGLLIYARYVKKQYWITIEVSRNIGGRPMRVATYVAREVPIGFAGDKLWKVSPKGLFGSFKTVKWLPVGKYQSAPRVWKYWIREDGEWINYMDDNLDEVSKKMGVKFVQEDMRLQRLATERLLEQRFMKKNFWERWGATIMMIILFLVIAVCMAIIFYQWSKLLDKQAEIERVQLESSKILLRVFGENYIKETLNNTWEDNKGLIPAS